jgi:hypothetical protein
MKLNNDDIEELCSCFLSSNPLASAWDDIHQEVLGGVPFDEAMAKCKTIGLTFKLLQLDKIAQDRWAHELQDNIESIIAERSMG